MKPTPQGDPPPGLYRAAFLGRSGLFYRNALVSVGVVLAAYGISLALPSNWLALLGLLPPVFLAYSVWTTFMSVHPPRWFAMRNVTPEIFFLPYEDIQLRTCDGLRLSGWFVPARGVDDRQAAVIILAHGRGGSCSSMILHLEALHKGGYSLLALDLRAHGRSQGDTSTFGILETQDILAAVDYLRTRQDVDLGRIGAFGVSLGAQAVLRAAALSPEIRAVGMEGLGSASLEDHGSSGRPASLRSKLYYPLNWFAYWLGDVMTGIRSPESTTAVIRRVSCPLLLISTGKGSEQKFNRLFYAAASQPKTLWELPRAKHAGGLVQDPKAYREKLLRFFDEALA
ncbi:MAG: alpha/beta fold hydrolase [Chloroflexota bacterium]